MQTRVNSNTDGYQAEPATVVLNDGSYVIVWHRYTDESSDIRARHYAADGTGIGGEVILITGEGAGDVEIAALDGGGFVLGWRAPNTTTDPVTGTTRYIATACYQIFAADGIPAGDIIRTTDDSRGFAIVALPGGGFASAVTQQYSWQVPAVETLQIFDAYGTQIAQISDVASARHGFASNLTVLQDGDILVAMIKDNQIISTRRYHPDGTAAGPEVRVGYSSYSLAQSLTVLELDDGRYMVGWAEDYTDEYLCSVRVYNADGTAQRSVNIDATGTFTLVNLPGEQYMAIWDSPENGLFHAQTYSYDGRAVGPQFDIVNGGGADYTPFPDVATLPNGDIVLTWEGYGNATANVYQNTLHTQKGNGNDNILTGGDGEDLLYGRSGNDTITGNGGIDVLTGDGGNDRLYGGAGDDFITGGTGSDIIDGGDGVDTLDFSRTGQAIRIDLARQDVQGTGEGNDIITGIENVIGSDWGSRILGNAANNVLTGGGYNDEIDGRDGDDIINAGTGDDVIFLSSGNDSIDAGDGYDTLSLAHMSGGVIVRLEEGQYEYGAFSGSIQGFESIIGGDGNDILAGLNDDHGDYDDDSPDQYNGSSLYGGAGDDIIIPGSDSDHIDGGDGSDTISFAEAYSYIRIKLAVTGAQRTEDEKDVIINVENVIGGKWGNRIDGSALNNRLEGGERSDEIRGIGGDDTILGGGGNDWLDGDGGADFLYGGEGDDTIVGDTGSDLIDGGNGIDRLSFEDAAAAIRVDLAQKGVQGTRQGNDTIRNIENVTGSRFDDRISGNSGANVLTGEAGNDTISGGKGSDMLDGGAGIDTLSFATAVNGIRISLAITGSQGTMEGNDVIRNFENVIGSRFDDRIAGNKGANVLTGGLGADLFLFATGSGNDRITDFSAAQNDRIDVSAYHAQSTAVITQHGGDAWIDLGGGNLIVVANTVSTDGAFLSHIIW